MTISHGVGSSQSRYAIHFWGPNPQRTLLPFRVDSHRNTEAETTHHFLVIRLDFTATWCKLFVSGRVVHSREIQMTKTVFRVLGLVASLVVGGAALAADAPAVEWKGIDGGNGHWYGIRMRTIPDMTWMQMRDAAVEDGGHLVTISNAAENSFAYNFWQSLHLDMMAGPLGYYILPGGQWLSVTGEAITYTNWRPALSNPLLNAAPDNGNALHRFVTWLDSPNWGALGGKWEDWHDSDLGNPADPISRFTVEWEADCNGDGVVDYGQIQSGELADTNNHSVPDVCELMITSVKPVSGASIGGTAVRINGNNFPNSPTVTFGGVAATDIVRVSPSLITAVTPAGTPGMTMVAVNGASSESFYYRPNCGSDLDNNGVVDSADVGIVLLDIGNCSESLTTPQEQEPLILQTVETPTPVLNKK